VNAMTAAVALLHAWVPQVSITNMVAMVMEFKERTFPPQDADMQTIQRLIAAA